MLTKSQAKQYIKFIEEKTSEIKRMLIEIRFNEDCITTEVARKIFDLKEDLKDCLDLVNSILKVYSMR